MLYPIVYIIAIISFGLSAVCGGGASFLLLPVLGLIMPANQVPASLSIGTTISSVSRIVLFLKNIRWDIVAWFVPFSLPAVWFGVSLLKHLNPAWLELLIGIFLIVNLPFLFKKQKETIKRRPRYVLSAIGLATGFISGLTGAVGLLFNRFYLNYGLSKEEVLATRAANEVLIHIIKIALYAVFGLMSVKSVAIGGILSLGAITASWLIRRILKYISENTFKKVGIIAMVISGAMMLSSASTVLYHKEQVRLGLIKIDDGLEAKLHTKAGHYSLEFKKDEGFELEKVIGFNELSKENQAAAKELAKGKEIVLVEEVHGWGKHTYEIYLHDGKKIFKKEL